jgi:ethanolamine utilization protein EutQ (cupin superfamily)
MNGISRGGMQARTVRFADLQFDPRFEYGEMCQVGEVLGSKESKLGFGFARMSDASIPWRTQYDEVLLIMEGELRIKMGDGLLIAGPGDSIVLPKNTELVYEAEHALVAYAIYPSDWAENN